MMHDAYFFIFYLYVYFVYIFTLLPGQDLLYQENYSCAPIQTIPGKDNPLGDSPGKPLGLKSGVR